MNYNRSNSNNFARTYSRLNQFLKERRRRSLGDQSCFAFPHMSPAPSSKSDPKRVEEEIARKVTMSLLPKNMQKEDIVSASEGQGEYYLNSLNLFPLTRLSSKEESPKITTNRRELPRPTEEPKTTTASMTIFYAGKVLVFDDLPEDKAQEVISLATQGITKSTNPQTSVETQTQPQSLASPSNSNMVATQDKQHTVSQEAGGPSELPIARRTSLFRFIEKRKDRVASAAPYQIHNNSSTAMMKSNPQRYNAVMRNLCQQHQEKQKQKRLLELKL